MVSENQARAHLEVQCATGMMGRYRTCQLIIIAETVFKKWKAVFPKVEGAPDNSINLAAVSPETTTESSGITRLVAEPSLGGYARHDLGP